MAGPVRHGISWRRGVLAVAAAAIGGALLVGVPVSAAHPVTPITRTTAQGMLTVDDHDYGDLTGCLTIRKVPRRLAVTNNTDQTVRVYLLPGCRGGVTRVIEPGRHASPLGAAVLAN
ncbi:MAG: hypothetical protein JWN03_482 [Nocardia sp.]|nr:hypothetical protein [Nocardia sp.]